ncbi:hypothetical protein [Thiomonas sp.]
MHSTSRPPPPLPAHGADAPDLPEILMSVVQVLMDQGWAASKISDDLRQTATVVELMHKTRGVPQ